MMSDHLDAAGHGGVDGREGRRSGGGHENYGGCRNQRMVKKLTRHVLKMEAIKNGSFDGGRAEHATLFEKSKKAIIDFICHEGS